MAMDRDMLRENGEKWTNKVTGWYPRGNKRRRGRQTKRWEDDFKKIVGPLKTNDSGC